MKASFGSVANGKSAAAVVLDEPRCITVRDLALRDPKPDDVVVETRWSAISTGTERLLWSGEMPPFPGLAYPLVPGYESVGRISWVGPEAQRSVGDWVFVPGAACHLDIAGLFGATSSRLVVEGTRVLPVQEAWGAESTLLALAATAHHALAAPGARPAELIVGHGVLGRLMARLAIALGHGSPTVWEKAPDRMGGASGYEVVSPGDDDRTNYAGIYDVSGDNAILDTLIARCVRGAEIALAGFYAAPLSFAFPPAFMREARIRIAAEFTPADLEAVSGLIASGQLNLDGLVTHVSPATDAPRAYATAFEQPDCLKMILDWSR